MSGVDPCFNQQIGRRRRFWTTKSNACGSYTLCGIECSIPGLVYEDQPTPNHGLPGDPAPGYRSINTDEWLNSLILNILNTRARTDLKCPAPAAVYGHWSESYRSDNLWIGSRLWNAAAKSYSRITDSVKAIQAAVQADMSKLVAMGVADFVDVEAVYRGRNTAEVTVTVTKLNSRHVLNLAGTLASDTWVWH